MPSSPEAILAKRDRDFSEATEIRLEAIARCDRQRRMTSAGGHHLAGLQRYAEPAQLVSKSSQGCAGIAEDVLAVADETVSAQRHDRLVFDSIHSAPGRAGRCNEQLRVL